MKFEPKFYLNWQEITGLDNYDEFFKLSREWWQHFPQFGALALDLDVTGTLRETIE